MTISPLVIIGTGLAGYNLAKEFRKLDQHTPLHLITADDGQFYSKPMLSTGFTKGKTADELIITSAEQMAEQLRATIQTFTRVSAIDIQQRLVITDQQKITYSKLVLAWGADVIHIPMTGDGVADIYTVNDRLDYQRFQQGLEGKHRVVILGAGLIGCEFANDLINGGYSVEVVALCDWVLPALLPEPPARAVEQALAALGVQWHLKTSVTQIQRHSNGSYSLTLTSGKILEADRVLSAIGLRPRIQLANHAGIRTNKGIIVNRRLETSVADIYALGDCAEVAGHVLLYVLPLMACARALAKNLAGTPTDVIYEAMPVTVKTPACPVVVAPPPFTATGQWQYEGAAPDIKATYYSNQVLQGFALTGSRVSEKMQLQKQLPHLF